MYSIIKDSSKGSYYAGLSPSGRILLVPTPAGATILTQVDAEEVIQQTLPTGTLLKLDIAEPTAAQGWKSPAGQDVVQALVYRIAQCSSDAVLPEEATAACEECGIWSINDVVDKAPGAYRWITDNRASMEGAVDMVENVLKELNLVSDKASIRKALLQEGYGDRLYYMRKVVSACNILKANAPMH